MIFGKIVNIHKKHTRFNSNFMGLLAVLQMSFLAAACRQLIVAFGRVKSGTGSTLDTAPAAKQKQPQFGIQKGHQWVS